MGFMIAFMEYLDIFVFIATCILSVTGGWLLIKRHRLKRACERLLPHAERLGMREDIPMITATIADLKKDRTNVWLMFIASVLIAIYKAQVIGIL